MYMFFLWIDCEMTGLQIEQDHILEIACILTTWSDYTKEIASYHAVIFHDSNIIDSINSFCFAMHTESGLLDKVFKSSLSYQSVEQEVLNMLHSSVGSEEVYIAGNSVYNDFMFIKKHLPKLAARLHYRTFDVSTLKLLAKINNIPPFKKEKKHEAMSDIHESIAEYHYYQKTLLK